MDNEAWEKCPSTTNVIEHRNTGCKQKQPIPLKMTMINIYRLDEAVSASTLLHKWCISHRDKDLRGMMCNLLSCLFSNFLARVRVCDHFNTVADQHE